MSLGEPDGHPFPQRRPGRVVHRHHGHYHVRQARRAHGDTGIHLHGGSVLLDGWRRHAQRAQHGTASKLSLISYEQAHVFWFFVKEVLVDFSEKALSEKTKSDYCRYLQTPPQLPKPGLNPVEKKSDYCR